AAPGVPGNDSDPNGNPLSAALVDDVSHGTLTLNVDGSFTYAPVAGFTGTDSFTYVANDGTVDSNVATVTITVTDPAFLTVKKHVINDGAGTKLAGDFTLHVEHASGSDVANSPHAGDETGVTYTLGPGTSHV